LKLVGTDEEPIYAAFRQLLNDTQAYIRMSQASNPYGNGKAAKAIVQVLLDDFNKQENLHM
jgi:UDP-N-acetylglucosamine 2-epimerase (non-hydrolysing)